MLFVGKIFVQKIDALLDRLILRRNESLNILSILPLFYRNGYYHFCRYYQENVMQTLIVCGCGTNKDDSLEDQTIQFMMVSIYAL